MEDNRREQSIVKRDLPRNLKPAEEYLFREELTKTIAKSGIVELKNVRVYPKFFVIVKNFTILKNTSLTASRTFTRKEFLQNRNQIVLRAYLNSSQKFSEAVWVLDCWSIEYFHWFTDTMSRIFALPRETRENKIFIFLENLSNKEFVTASLKIVGVNNIAWLKTYEIARVRNLIVPEYQAPSGNYNESVIRSINSLFRDAVAFDKLKRRRIYISRKNSKFRRTINEPEVVGLLREFDFEVICFEEHSWEEQLLISLETEICVGVHGAGLTNMIFMNSGASILELRREGDPLNNCYFSLASAAGLKYYYQLCETDQPEELTQYNNFYVDVAELKKNIELILSDV